MITLDGAKMSKSRGNLIAPEHYFATLGADSLRLFHLFVGPPADDFDWSAQSDQMMEGCHRFLGRVWRLATGGVERMTLVERQPTAADIDLEKGTHRLIDRVSRDFERWSYNTAVAAAMEFVNTVYRHVQAADGARARTVDFAIDSLLLLLAPMAPHVTAELWEHRHGEGSRVHAQVLAGGGSGSSSRWRPSPWWCRSMARCETALRSRRMSAKTKPPASPSQHPGWLTN